MPCRCGRDSHQRRTVYSTWICLRESIQRERKIPFVFFFEIEHKVLAGLTELRTESNWSPTRLAWDRVVKQRDHGGIVERVHRDQGKEAAGTSARVDAWTQLSRIRVNGAW